MIDFIVFACAVVGLTNIITHSTIASPIREWVLSHVPEKYSHGIECSQCVGFWSGFILGGIILGFPAIMPEYSNQLSYWIELLKSISLNFVYLLIYGFASSFLSVLSANIMGYLDSQSYIDIPGE